MTGSDWRPGASLERLRARATLLAAVRAFFAARGVLEVETPALARFGVSDPNIENLETTLELGGRPVTLYLQSSPEYAMKRLLCAGSGPIYQLCRCFRAGEVGALHNPEFSMLEWYRPGFSMAALMDEVEALIATVLELDEPARSVTYRDAMRGAVGLDPLAASAADVRAACGEAAAEWSRGECLDWLFASAVQPALGSGLVHVHDFPADQAALARVDAGAGTSRRFESFVNGIELANGYHELDDPQELARRDAANGAPEQCDTRLVAAMRHGLPDCAGVALGFDRLVMLATGAARLGDVVAFDASRA